VIPYCDLGEGCDMSPDGVCIITCQALGNLSQYSAFPEPLDWDDERWDPPFPPPLVLELELFEWLRELELVLLLRAGINLLLLELRWLIALLTLIFQHAFKGHISDI
jgi:hypothetical protein